MPLYVMLPYSSLYTRQSQLRRSDGTRTVVRVRRSRNLPAAVYHYMYPLVFSGQPTMIPAAGDPIHSTDTGMMHACSAAPAVLSFPMPFHFSHDKLLEFLFIKTAV